VSCWIPSQTHWNLIGRSKTVPQLCYRPAVFVRHLRLIVFSVPQGTSLSMFQKCYLNCFTFSNCESLKLHKLKMRKSGSASINAVYWTFKLHYRLIMVYMITLNVWLRFLNIQVVLDCYCLCINEQTDEQHTDTQNLLEKIYTRHWTVMKILCDRVSIYFVQTACQEGVLIRLAQDAFLGCCVSDVKL
jgi:hypothetical protein